MSTLSRKDANDLRFTTRDQAVDVVIRLMEERDTLLEALKSLIDMDVAYQRGSKVEDAVEKAHAAIAKATGQEEQK